MKMNRVILQITPNVVKNYISDHRHTFELIKGQSSNARAHS